MARLTPASGSSERGSAALLARVGERVREHRARLGMTRKALARDSSVSERYLAQLEHGQGNISIGLLQQIAAALGADLAALVTRERERSAEQRLVEELMTRLGPADQERARALLEGYFSAQGGRHARVALLGMRGAGKTTLGELLAARRGVPFVRLVGEIEKLAGLDVSEILSLSGQGAYRRLQHQALAETFRRHERCVVEPGGGIVAAPDTFNALLTNSFVVWLRATPEEHMQRVIEQGDLRPMRSNKSAMTDLRRILRERAPQYAKAHATLDTSGRTIRECLARLVELVPADATVSSPRTAGRPLS